MTIEENVYRTIRKMSNHLISEGNEWRKEISSAKNYVATSDFKHWTYGKSAGLNNKYHPDGGAAKKWLYSIGFINILKLPESQFKYNVLKYFEIWALKVEAFDILGKFNKDQNNNQRFEILIHNRLIPQDLISKTNVSEINQSFFDEGFKKMVSKEVTARSKKVVNEAKIAHGVICKVCGFDFGKMYGNHGLGFIEIHHFIILPKNWTTS